MTRERYIKKVQHVVVEASNKLARNPKLGEALKYTRDHATDVPKVFGSYDAAWNSEAMKSLRDMLEI